MEWLTMGIKVFPDNSVPSEDEISNQFVDVGLSATKKGFKIERRFARTASAYYSTLWNDKSVISETKISEKVTNKTEPDTETKEKPTLKQKKNWGLEADDALILERRTIKLDGKEESWAGIEPVSGSDTQRNDFLGSPDYNIKSLYLCRDDKYLYWRIDFNSSNPSKAQLKTVPKEINTQLLFQYESDHQLITGINYLSGENRFKPYESIWDNTVMKSTKIENMMPKFFSGKDRIEGQFLLSTVGKYCKGPVQVYAMIKTETNIYGKQNARTRRVYIDPLK
jgi:hypothetical protein